MRASGERDASGNLRLPDICGLLRSAIDEHLNTANVPYTLKFIDPSYIIRSVPANANDRVYCGFLGQNAVHAGMAGKTVAEVMTTDVVSVRPTDTIERAASLLEVDVPCATGRHRGGQGAGHRNDR